MHDYTYRDVFDQITADGPYDAVDAQQAWYRLHHDEWHYI
jgi:hypothetical protein